MANSRHKSKLINELCIIITQIKNELSSIRRSIYLWTIGMVDVNGKGSIFHNHYDKKNHLPQHIMYIGTCIFKYIFYNYLDVGINVYYDGLKLIVQLFIMTKTYRGHDIKSSKSSCRCNLTIIFTIHKKMSPVMILDLLMDKYRRVQSSPSTMNF